MIKQKIILFFLMASLNAKVLGENLLVNSQFSSPNISSINLEYTMIPLSIPGWSCTYQCQINQCQKSNAIFVRKYTKFFADCHGQIIDTRSNTSDTITQIFQADEGQHLLQLKYFLPMFLGSKKSLLAYFNGKVVFRYRPLFPSIFDMYKTNITIYPVRGNNNISFITTGLNDGAGFRLASVQIKQVFNTQQSELIENILMNDLLTTMISIPGSRVIFGELVNLLVSFDRFQLYAYHTQAYNNYTTTFINALNKMMSQKGSLSQATLEYLFSSSYRNMEKIIQELNYKSVYVYLNLQKVPPSGFGFIANNSNILIYSLPFYLLTSFILYIIFWMTINDKVSVLLRKYCFLGIILLMLCDGNIEQFTFFIICEFKAFFSFTFTQKLGNSFIIFFSFIVYIGSTALYFILWIHYKKNVKYFINDTQISLTGLSSYTLDKGFFCCILGVVHSILLEQPQKQLKYLFIVEISWIIYQIVSLSLKSYKNLILVFLSIFEGLIRSVMILSLPSLQKLQSSGKESWQIRSGVNLSLQYILLSLWGVSLFYSICSCIIQLCILLKQRVQKTSSNIATRNDSRVNSRTQKLKPQWYLNLNM